MRVAILKENLLSSRPNLSGPVRRVITPLNNKGWGPITSRVPLLSPTQHTRPEQLNPLDGGFFFPLPLQEGEYGIPYKKLVMGAKPPRRPATASVDLRANASWEILEGGKVDLVGYTKGAPDPSLGEDYTSSLTPDFYTGTRPRDREYQPTRDKRPLSAFDKLQVTLKGRLLGEEGGELGGYPRALRLLPKKKRGKAPRGSGVDKVGAVRRPAKYSGLRIPLFWSKSLNDSWGPGPEPRPPLLHVRASASLKGEALPRGVLDLNTAGLNGLAKKNQIQATPYGGGLRIVQTRYKPGLSKWWRLLRLHYCICWGLPWLRQRRFTNYISQLAHVTGLGFIRMCSSSIGFVVRASFLVFPQTLLGEKAFVNGTYITNPFFQVYKGDRVSVLSPSVPSKHRRQAFTAFLKAPPFKSWEVDGLTRSVSIWAEPSVKELQDFAFKRPVPFLTFRMYNWKYRH